MAGARPETAAGGWRRPVRWVVGDWRRFNPKAGAVAVVVVIVVLLAVREHGLTGLVTSLAIIQGLMVAVPLRAPARVKALIAFTLLGGAVTALGLWVGEQQLPAVASLVAVSFVAGLTTAVGPVTSRVCSTVAIWFLTMVFYARRAESLPRITLAFVVGMLVLTAVVWLAPRLRRADDLLPAGDETLPRTRFGWWEAVRRRGALRFATVLAGSAGLALALGWRWFPDHPHWAAATLLLLLRPDPGQSLLASLQRMAGTLAGGALVVWLVSEVRDPRLLLAVLLAAAFLTAATVGVGQTAFSIFFTLLLLTVIELTGGDSAGSAADRVAEVAIGAGIAIAATALLQVLPPPPDAGLGPDPGPDPEPMAVG